MQVSQLAELDSHVVIGGAKPKAFFMSDSAEFFTILSSTLYRDKKLAVVREVICNAWDAHIMAGKQSVPIEITLTDDELTIKDFGPGISDAKMHPTYCGYGVSTKVADDTQTGGFGLGCKAPFAYSDHFTVVSAHGGWKTTYAISRGGMQSDGKPGLIPMVKVQSDESGLTVSVPLKDADDRHEFARLIQRVVRHGGIQATFNGAKQLTYDFATIDKTGYGTIYAPDLEESSVYVRYGTVLYPLTTVDKHINALAANFRNYASIKLVLSAPPGSVGVTPSREALSYTDQVTASLTEMVERATKQIQGRMSEALRELADQAVERETDEFISFSLQDSPLQKGQKPFAADALGCAVMLMRAAYGNGAYLHGFRFGEGQRKKAILRAAMRKHRDGRRIYRRAMNKSTTEYKRFAEGFGCFADTTRLLIRLVAKFGLAKITYRYGEGCEEDEYNYVRRRTKLHTLTKCVEPFYKTPILVLTTGKQQISGFLNNKSSDDQRQYAFVVTRNMKPEKIEAIKELARHYKFDLLELERPAPVKREKVVRTAVASEKYWPLAAAVGAGRIWIDKGTSFQMIERAPLYLDMKTTKVNNENYDYFIRKFLEFAHLFTAVYPVVALAHGQAQKKALEKMGARPLEEVVLEDLKAIKDTPENRFAIMCSKGHICASDYGNNCANLASDLAKSDLRYGKLLTGKKMTVSKEEVFTHRIVKLLSKVNDLKGEAHEAVHKLVDKKGYPLTKAQTDWLKPLTHLYEFKSNSRSERDPFEFNDDLVDLIRFVQRKQQRKSALNTQPQPLKEAA